MIGVNLIMMRLAIQTLPGTEVESAYSASLAYEKEIAAAHEQNLRNWQVDAHVQRSADGGAMLRVEARDNSGRPISGLRFVGRFERPTDRRADRSVTLAETGIGIYSGNAAMIASGQWDLVLQGRHGRSADVPVAQSRAVELGGCQPCRPCVISHITSGMRAPGRSHIDLAVEGVSCAGCMSKIERGLSAIPDVTLARVNLTDRRVALEWREERA